MHINNVQSAGRCIKVRASSTVLKSVRKKLNKGTTPAYVNGVN